MIDRRTVAGCFLICFPALIATYVSVRAIEHLRPIYAEQERAQLKAECREVVEELRDNPEKGSGGQRPENWDKAYAIGKGRWGYVEKDEQIVVWYLNNKRMQVVEVPRSDRLSFSTLVLPTTCLSLGVFWFTTLAGCFLFARSIRERDDFVAATAHDLTTPLVALRRLVGQNDEEAKVVVERMLRLVKNLTDYLKLRGGRLVEIKEFDLRKVYDEAYSLFREDFRWLANGKDVTVVGEAKLIVKSDRLMVEQIIWNLLSNALKYGAPYGPITVRFESDEKLARVVFADEGQGLKPHEMKRIFNRYYRAKSVMKSGKGGFGIGLCTAREHARFLGGDLTVAANQPTGCVFTLILKKGKAAKGAV